MKIPFYLKMTAFVTCIIFTTNTLCIASPEPVYSIKVRSDYGKVSERWSANETRDRHAAFSGRTEPVSQPSPRTVIIIQDAHESYDAQLNIAGILEDLAQEKEELASNSSSDNPHSPEVTNFVIGIEGAIGRIDVDHLRSYPIPEARRKTADELLKKGYITGSEYALISSDHELVMWGIENEDIFRKNFRSFLKILSKKDEITRIFESEVSFLGAQKKAHYSNELAEFNRVEEAYLNEEISFETFCEALFQELSKCTIDTTGYLQLELFKEILREKEETPEHTSYKDALLDYSALLEELKRLSLALKRDLAASEIERVLIERDRLLKLSQKVYTLRATRSEVNEWKTLVRDLHTKDETPFLTGATREENATFLAALTDEVLDFYTLAERRDEAMLTTLFSKMDEEEKTIGVVIAGGYHSEGIKARLKERRIPYLVITPTIYDIHKKIAYMDRMLGHIAPIDPILTSYIHPTLFNTLADELSRDYANSGLLAKVQERLIENGTLQVSRINATMEAICGNVGKETIMNYFGDVWCYEVSQAPDWASVIYLLKDSANFNVQKRAKAIYDFAHRQNSESQTHSRAVTLENIDEMVSANTFVDELGELLGALTPPFRNKEKLLTYEYSLFNEVPPRYAHVTFVNDARTLSQKRTGEALNEQEKEWISNARPISIRHTVSEDVLTLYGSELFDVQKDITIDVSQQDRLEAPTMSDALRAFCERNTIGKENGMNVYFALYLEALEALGYEVLHAIVVGSYGWGLHSIGDDFDVAIVTDREITVNDKNRLRTWWNDNRLPNLSAVFSTQSDIAIKSGDTAYSKATFTKLLEKRGFLYFSEVVGSARNIIAELKSIRTLLLADDPLLSSLRDLKKELLEMLQPLSVDNFTRVVERSPKDEEPSALNPSIKELYMKVSEAEFINILIRGSIASAEFKQKIIGDIHHSGFSSDALWLVLNRAELDKQAITFKPEKDNRYMTALSDIPISLIQGYYYYQVYKDSVFFSMLEKNYAQSESALDAISHFKARMTGRDTRGETTGIEDTPESETPPDAPAMAIQFTEEKWEQIALQPEQHRVLNHVWQTIWDDGYLVNDDDMIVKDIREILESTGVRNELSIHVHAPHDSVLYERLYKEAIAEGVSFPQSDRFLLITHPGTYRTVPAVGIREARSFNLLVPRSVYTFLHAMRDANKTNVYEEWLHHEAAHLVALVQNESTPEAIITKAHPIENMIAAYSTYVMSEGSLAPLKPFSEDVPLSISKDEAVQMIYSMQFLINEKEFGGTTIFTLGELASNLDLPLRVVRSQFQKLEKMQLVTFDDQNRVVLNQKNAINRQAVSDLILKHLSFGTQKPAPSETVETSESKTHAATGLDAVRKNTQSEFVPAAMSIERSARGGESYRVESLGPISTFLSDTAYTFTDEPYISEAVMTIDAQGTVHVLDVPENIIVCSRSRSTLEGAQKIRFTLSARSESADKTQLKIEIFDPLAHTYIIGNYYVKDRPKVLPRSIFSVEKNDFDILKAQSNISFFCTKGYIEIDEDVSLLNAGRANHSGNLYLFDSEEKIFISNKAAQKMVDLRLFHDPVHGTVLECSVDGEIQNYYYYDERESLHHLRELRRAHELSQSLVGLDLVTFFQGKGFSTPRFDQPLYLSRKIGSDNRFRIAGTRVAIAHNERFNNTYQDIALTFKNYAGDAKKGKTFLEVAIKDKKNPDIYRTSALLDNNAHEIYRKMIRGFSFFSNAKKGIYLFLKYGISVLENNAELSTHAGIVNQNGQINFFQDPLITLGLGLENAGKEAVLRLRCLENGVTVLACEVEENPVAYYFYDHEGNLQGGRKPIHNSEDYLSLAYLDVLNFMHNVPYQGRHSKEIFAITSHVYGQSIHINGIGQIPVFSHRIYAGTQQRVALEVQLSEEGELSMDAYHLLSGEEGKRHLVRIIRKDNDFQYVYSEEQRRARVSEEEDQVLAFLNGNSPKLNGRTIQLRNVGTVTTAGTVHFIEKGRYVHVCTRHENVGEQVDFELKSDFNYGPVLACIVKGEVKNYYYKNQRGELVHLHAQGGEELPPISLTYIDFLHYMNGKRIRTVHNRDPFEVTRYVDYNAITVGKHRIPVFPDARYMGTQQTFSFRHKRLYQKNTVEFDVYHKKSDEEYDLVANIALVLDIAHYIPKVTVYNENALSKDERALVVFVKNNVEQALHDSKEILFPDFATINARGAIPILRTGEQLRICKYGEHVGEKVSLRLFQDVNHGTLLECTIHANPVNYYRIDKQTKSLQSVHALTARQESNSTPMIFDLLLFFKKQKIVPVAERVPFEIVAPLSNGSINIGKLGRVKVLKGDPFRGERRAFRFMFEPDATNGTHLNVYMKMGSEESPVYEHVSSYVYDESTRTIKFYYIESGEESASDLANEFLEEEENLQSVEPIENEAALFSDFVPSEVLDEEDTGIDENVIFAQDKRETKESETRQYAPVNLLSSMQTFLQGNDLDIDDSETYIFTDVNLFHGRIKVPGYGYVTVAKKEVLKDLQTVRARFVKKRNFGTVLEFSLKTGDERYEAIAYYFRVFNDKKVLYADDATCEVDYFLTGPTAKKAGVTSFEELEVIYFLQGYHLTADKQGRWVDLTARISVDGSVTPAFRKNKKKIMAGVQPEHFREAVSVRLYDDPNHGVLLAIAVVDNGERLITNYYYRDEESGVQSLRNLFQSQGIELSLAGFDIVSFLSGKDVRPVLGREQYTPQGFLRDQGLINLPVVGELLVAGKNAYEGNMHTVTFNFFTDHIHGTMVECLVGGKAENYYYRDRTGKIKHFRDASFSRYYSIRSLAEYDMARYLTGQTYDVLPKRRDNAGHLITRISINQKIKKGRLTFFDAKDRKIHNLYNDKELAFEMVEHPTKGICLAVYVENDLIGFLVYDEKEQAPVFHALKDDISYYQKSADKASTASADTAREHSTVIKTRDASSVSMKSFAIIEGVMLFMYLFFVNGENINAVSYLLFCALVVAGFSYHPVGEVIRTFLNYLKQLLIQWAFKSMKVFHDYLLDKSRFWNRYFLSKKDLFLNPDMIVAHFKVWIAEEREKQLEPISDRDMFDYIVKAIDSLPQKEKIMYSEKEMSKLFERTLGVYSTMPKKMVGALVEAQSEIYTFRNFTEYIENRDLLLEKIVRKYHFSHADLSRFIDILNMGSARSTLSVRDEFDDELYCEITVYYAYARPGILHDMLAPIEKIANINWIERLHKGRVRSYHMGVRVPKTTDLKKIREQLNAIPDVRDDVFEKLNKQKWILECEIIDKPGALYALADKLKERNIRLSAFLTPTMREKEKQTKLIFELEIPETMKEQDVYTEMVAMIGQTIQMPDEADVLIIPGTLIDRIVYELIAELNLMISSEEYSLISRALEAIGRKHISKARKNRKNSYISHFTEVAKILVKEIGLEDYEALLAALLHDVIEDEILTQSEVLDLFGPQVMTIVNLVTRYIPKEDGGESLYFENLLFGDSDSIAEYERAKAILVKCSDRTHNLRTVQTGNKAFERRIFFSTLDSFVFDFLNQLGRVSFSDEYKVYVDRAIHLVKKELFTAGFNLGFIDATGKINDEELRLYLAENSGKEFTIYQELMNPIAREVFPLSLSTAKDKDFVFDVTFTNIYEDLNGLFRPGVRTIPQISKSIDSVQETRVGNIFVRWEVPLTTQKYENYLSLLDRVLMYIENRYFGLVTQFKSNAGTISIVDTVHEFLVVDGNIAIPQDALKAGLDFEPFFIHFVEKAIVPQLVSENAYARSLIEKSLTRGNGLLRPLSTYLEKVFWVMRAEQHYYAYSKVFNQRNVFDVKVITNPYLNDKEKTVFRKLYAMLEKQSAHDLVAMCKLLFLYSLMSVQTDETSLHSTREREAFSILNAFIVNNNSVDEVWANVVEPFGEIAAYVNETTFSNEWLRAEDKAINENGKSTHDNQKERFEALRMMRHKGEKQERALKLYIDPLLKHHDLFQILEKVIDLSRSTSIAIDTNVDEESADLILAPYREDATWRTKTLFFSLDNGDALCAEVALFRSIFLRLLNKSISESGTIGVALENYNLLEWRNGFFIDSHIVNALNDDVRSYLKTRLVQTAA